MRRLVLFSLLVAAELALAEEPTTTKTREISLPECLYSGSCPSSSTLLFEIRHPDLIQRLDCGRGPDQLGEIRDLCDWKHNITSSRFLVIIELVKKFYKQPEHDASAKRSLLHWCMADQALWNGLSVKKSDPLEVAGEHCLTDIAEEFPWIFDQPGWALTDDAAAAIIQRKHEQTGELIQSLRGIKKLQDHLNQSDPDNK